MNVYLWNFHFLGYQKKKSNKNVCIFFFFRSDQDQDPFFHQTDPNIRNTCFNPEGDEHCKKMLVSNLITERHRRN